MAHLDNQIKLRKLLEKESFENLDDEQLQILMKYVQNVKLPNSRSELGRQNYLSNNPNIPKFMKPPETQRESSEMRPKVLTNQAIMSQNLLFYLKSVEKQFSLRPSTLRENKAKNLNWNLRLKKSLEECRSHTTS